MKTYGLTFLLVVLALAGLAPASARAAVSITTPFGADSAVWVWIGSDAANTRPLACYARAGDTERSVKRYFYGQVERTSLSGDVDVHGSNNDDQLIVVVAPTLTPCGLMFTLNQNGHVLGALGGDGNDSLRGGVAVGTVLCGENGNDIVDITADFGVASGGRGDDFVTAVSPLATREALFGESGNDCLYDASLTTSVLSGGTGRDVSPLYIPWLGMPASVRCNAGGTCDVEGWTLACAP
jgi:Ca2+-binding RTX toxin-like protein